MKIKKLLGIWMDHSIAHLMEFKNNMIVSETIEADSFVRDDEGINWRDESLIQNKEQIDLSNYFDKLIYVIKDYDEVLLFGPTEAKSELFNQIDTFHKLDMIKITMKTTDKMTENQRQAFVRDFFTVPGKPSRSIKNKSFFFF
jgi:hypothetical protein